MSKGHVKFVKAHSAHNPPGSGCIVYCTSQYEEGNPHSHRWNAAEKARTEKVYKREVYGNCEVSQEVNTWSRRKLRAFARHGGLDGPVMKSGGKSIGRVKPFSCSFHPFDHNAHHIIPSSSIESSIDRAVKRAAPHEWSMRSFVVGNLLSEPYNNNGRPNVIVLPMKFEDAVELGLPLHTDGRPDHPAYRRRATAQIRGHFQSAYRSAAQAFAAKKHPDPEPEVPKLGPTLVAISEQTYKAIIKLAEARALQGKAREDRTLDAVRRLVLRGARQGR